MKSGSGLNNFTATMCPSSPFHPKTIYAQSTLHAREHVFKACIWTLDSIVCMWLCVCVCVCLYVCVYVCVCVWQGNTQWTGKNSYSTIGIKYMEMPGESLMQKWPIN